MNTLKNNLLHWNTEDVINWLNNEVGLDYNEYFRAHDIIGRDLIDLTEDNLKYDLKVLKVHDRKLILRKICELMRLIVENNKDDKLLSVSSTRNTNFTNNSEIKLINVICNEYKETIKFKCNKNIKVLHLINDCIDILSIPKDKNVILTNRSGSVLPKEAFITNYEDECNTFYLIFKNKKNTTNQIDLSINEISKNKYLSFDASKYGYSFSLKKNYNEKDKVTINSFYNISNLNNYEKSLFPSNENKLSSTINNMEIGEEDNIENNIKKKKNKYTCIRSKKKIDIDDLSEEVDIKLLKQSDSDFIKPHQNISQDFNYKNEYFDRLYKYYNDANKIKHAKKQNNQSENDIHNYLKSVKKSSTFVINEDQNKDSRLKTYMQETKKYKNLRNFLHKNINSSISKPDNFDSSISN